MSIDVTETDIDSMYNDGYDHGYAGHAKFSDNPSYLEGYYDGLQDADDEEDFTDGDYDLAWYDDED